MQIHGGMASAHAAAGHRWATRRLFLQLCLMAALQAVHAPAAAAVSPNPDLPSFWITLIAIALAVALLAGGLLLLRRYRRTAAQLALWQQRLSQYIQVLEGYSNSLILMDRDLQITAVNGGFCRLTGYTQD